MQRYKPIIIVPTFSFSFSSYGAAPYHRFDEGEGSRSVAERFIIVIKTKPSSAHLQRSVVTLHVANIVIVICFGIDEKFMSGESFEYTAIIESKEVVKDLRRKIEFKHRIANTSKIRNEYIVGQQSQYGSLGMDDPAKEKSLGVMTLMAVLFFGLLTLSLLFQQKVQYYVQEKGSDKELSVYITPQSQLYMSDNELIPFFDNKKITKEEIDKKYDIAFKTSYSWGSDNSVLGIFLAILTLFYLFSALMVLYIWNRKKRIYQLLEQYEKE